MQLLLMVSLFLWSSGLCRTEEQHSNNNNTGPQCETTDKADIVLLVVCSRSPASTFLDMKKFLRRIVTTFDIGPDKVQIGLVCYSSNPKTEWHLNTHKTQQSLLEAIANLQGHEGLVLTGHALDDVLQNSFKPDVGMREDSQKMAVLITDGASQDDPLPPSQHLKDAGIEIYAIGVNDAAESELRSIASDPDETHMYNVMDSVLLQDIVDNLVTNLCNSTHCSEPVRLVGGASRCAGTLEVKHGEWRPVYGSDWTLTSADTVCRKLFCGSAVSTGMREESLHISVWKISSVCVRSGFALKECVKLGSSSSIIQITCSDSVRLVDGTSLCSGRLEVKSDQSNQSNQSNQQWSSVCEDDFDQQDAEVVCRELGCGAPSVLQGALYGEGEAPVWTKEFQCAGNESALLDCRRSDSVRNTCSPGKSAGLTCSEPVRLVGGASRCAGTLEVKQGDWRPVYGSDWTLRSTDTVCRKLFCGSAVSTGMRKAITLKSVWEISSVCIESGRALRECVTSGSSSSIIEITCSVSVRLVDGTSLCSGRLEVKSDQSDQSNQSNQSNQWWSSVCEDDFDQQDAEVVCRELGCGAPSVLQGALYGEVVAPMWTKEFQCAGNESALLDCRRSDSVRNTCSPGKSAGLTCSEPVRLVGGASRCAGTLEVKHGEWRPVYGYWTLKSVAEVCRNLDCGSAVSIDWRQESSDRLVWDISYYCTPAGLSLRECLTSGSSSSIMEITCADHTVFKVRLVVLPLTLLLLVTVTCVIQTSRGQKLSPQENLEPDHYDFGVGEVEGGPDEEEGAQSAV